MQKIVFRADASIEIGTGHIMRCLSLAQYLQDIDKQVSFVTASITPTLKARLESQGISLIQINTELGGADDAAKTVKIASDLSASWIILDGYHFHSDYQRALKNAGFHLLDIDDYYSSDHYYADIVLNQNLHCDENKYLNKESYTSLLLGTSFVLLRKEFLKWRHWKRRIPFVAKKLLVTMGGSDSGNITLKVMQALGEKSFNNLEVTVIAPDNLYLKELETTAKKFGFRIVKVVKNMPELMAWADVAINAGGTTSWELAFMGAPILAIVLAGNQRQVVEELAKINVAINLGWCENLVISEMRLSISKLMSNAQLRRDMSKMARALVDGRGPNRVAMCMDKISGNTHWERESLGLRLANKDDALFIWKLANDPEVRAVSFFSGPIPWEDHLKWFEAKLNSDSCYFFIALDSNNRPIGQVKFDIANNEAVISISLIKEFRGKGVGAKLIRFSTEQIFKAEKLNKIHAYIKQTNKASIAAFQAANFVADKTIILQNNQVIDFIKGDKK